MFDPEISFLFDIEPSDPVDEERIEYGAETIYTGIVPHISHQTGEFDPTGYIAGYKETRRQLLEEDEYKFTEADFERCLMHATEWAEAYVQQLREAEIEDQLNG